MNLLDEKTQNSQWFVPEAFIVKDGKEVKIVSKISSKVSALIVQDANSKGAKEAFPVCSVVFAKGNGKDEVIVKHDNIPTHKTTRAGLMDVIQRVAVIDSIETSALEDVSAKFPKETYNGLITRLVAEAKKNIEFLEIPANRKPKTTRSTSETTITY